MSNRITYHLYSPGDEKGITELLKIVFPKWRGQNNPLDNWTWKHLEGPHPSEVYVAKDGEQIVGAIHRLVLNIKIGDSILRSHYGDDLAVHPDYREHGIWKKLKNMADEKQVEHGIKFSYIATENPIVKENIIKMGFNPSKHSISHFLKIRNRETFLKKKERDNLVTNIGIAALTGWSEVKQRFSSENQKNEDFSIVEVPKFDDNIDAFWERVKENYGYCVVKKADYLNWKHNRPTTSAIKLRVALKGEEVLGFSALSLREDEDYREGSISDLLALSERPDVASALMVDACDYFNHEGVAATFFQATKGHPYGVLAERNGFIDASSQNSTYFYYSIIGNSVPADYLENLHPSRVQLNYF